MTVAISDIADTLRWVWVVLGVFWVGYGWLYRVSYARIVGGLIGLGALDWGLHAVAGYAERPGSQLPSDFALYSVMMVTAALAGVTTATVYARWQDLDVTALLTAALLCVIAGGIGGRVYQVWTNPVYYGENADIAFDLAYGGFGIRGALVGGVLALAVFSGVARVSFWKLADAGALGMTTAQSIGWYGAALTHAHSGLALDAPAPAGVFAAVAQIVRSFGYNFVQDLPDAYGLIAFRIPVQMVAAIVFLALLLVLVAIARAKRGRNGAVAAWYLVLSGLAGFILGFWRGDEAAMWNGLRVDQWVDLILVVAGGVVVWLQYGRASISPLRVVQHA
jgi:prolipoprotein diacylglyceryltransferase